MKQLHFLFFCSLLFVLQIQVYSGFRSYFNSGKELEVKLSRVEADLDSMRLNYFLAQSQIRDFKQEVALLLPEAVRSTSSGEYSLRTLASVVQEGEPLSFDRHADLLRDGKKAFYQRDYPRAIELLSEWLGKGELALANIEVHFLLSESYLLSGNYDLSLEIIDTMVRRFPEHELTGYALIRAGQIYKLRDRSEQARQVFSVIRSRFEQVPDLRTRAESELRGLSL